jgi:hypothetical protein
VTKGERTTKAFVKAWLDKPHSYSINSYHLLFKHDIMHLAIVLIFNFSFSIKHLYQADGTKNSMPSQMLQRQSVKKLSTDVD